MKLCFPLFCLNNTPTLLSVPKQVLAEACTGTFYNFTSKWRKAQHFVLPIFPNAQDSEATLSDNCLLEKYL